MEKEQWDACQKLIDAGLTEIVVDALVKEIEDELTPEQMKPLGDLRSLLLRMLPSQSGVPADKIISHIVYLAREGVILGRKPNT